MQQAFQKLPLHLERPHQKKQHHRYDRTKEVFRAVLANCGEVHFALSFARLSNRSTERF